MEYDGNVLSASPGMTLVRKADGKEAGVRVHLGKCWYRDNKLLQEPYREVPGDYEEIPIAGEENKPETDKAGIMEAINAVVNDRILSGMIWRGHRVWLSLENQMNYRAALDSCRNTGGANLPVRFKLGTGDTPDYVDIGSWERLEDFVGAMTGHIQTTLVAGWEAKDACMRGDWDKVAEYLGAGVAAKYGLPPDSPE